MNQAAPPPLRRLGYDAFQHIDAALWASAAAMVDRSGRVAAHRTAIRRARREAGRGDYFSARDWVRIAEAIQWLSSPRKPTQLARN